jgi:hypothetical protein
MGRDQAARAAAARLDGWLGRVWRPRARTLLAGDLWGAGYVTDAPAAGTRELAAASLRAALTGFRGTRDGLWTLRVGAERRLRPDPDARPFVGLDPTAALVGGEVRLAGTAAAASLERSTHVWTVARTLVLDAAAFGALSRRWHPAARGLGDPVTLGVAGAALRLAPTRPGQPTAGLELVYPAVRPAGVGREPFVRLVITPWFGAVRGR